MNKVDIYINNQRLDLFQDEEISINLNVQNIQDISKVFTDFTQSFTVPASTINNQILSHYYRTDLTGSFDGRLRQSARIEINSIPFRTGVVEMENVLMKGNEPYSYSLAFYGDLVNLSDLFGEDYLYELDLSSYDHTYDGATIQSGFDQNALFSGEIIYPLMSPVKNWYYNSSVADVNDSNIAYNGAASVHGIHYNELKPAVQVLKILEAIEAKYSISFTGSFLSNAQFLKLYLWAHRFEGYLYDNATAIDWQVINFDNNSGGGTQFDLATDIWTVGETHEHLLRVTVYNPTAAYELGLFVNGVESGIAREDAGTGFITSVFDGYIFNAGDQVQLKIRPQLPVTMTYQVTAFGGWTSDDGVPDTLQFGVDQTFTATYTFQLVMSPLMPEIKVKDFLKGLVNMHNLVIIPTSATSFSLQTLNDWYASGIDQNLTENIDVKEITINRPQLYREITFDYQDTEQILGYQYQQTNILGYGDLNAFFSWDGDEYNIELPFECPLFEKLTDQNTSSLTNVLPYKSITREADDAGNFNTYVGAPILIYADFSIDISSNPICFVDESSTQIQIDTLWYVNTSSSVSGTGLAYALTWGSDIDPYYLEPIGKSLYQTYWKDYIEDLYNSKRRVVEVEALLSIGDIIKLDLKNKVIWNNQKWFINSASVNMTTGKTKLELLNAV